MITSKDRWKTVVAVISFLVSAVFLVVSVFILRDAVGPHPSFSWPRFIMVGLWLTVTIGFLWWQVRLVNVWNRLIDMLHERKSKS